MLLAISWRLHGDWPKKMPMSKIIVTKSCESRHEGESEYDEKTSDEPVHSNLFKFLSFQNFVESDVK
jgi:hypothetical protein